MCLFNERALAKLAPPSLVIGRRVSIRCAWVGVEVIQSIGMLTKIALSKEPSPNVLKGTSVRVA